MILTPEQKLAAMSARFYDGLEWAPKAGDLYTSTRDDLEVYRVVDVDHDRGVILTMYTDGTEEQTAWDAEEFTKAGFGPKRVFVPQWVFDK